MIFPIMLTSLLLPGPPHGGSCNGEIYNFRDLRYQLEKRGCKFKSKSDSEVVLHGYTEFGEEIFNRLNGMFAIAIWDAHKNQ